MTGTLGADGFTFGHAEQLLHLLDERGQDPRLVHVSDVVLQVAFKLIQLVSHIHEHAELNDNELETQSKG